MIYTVTNRRLVRHLDRIWCRAKATQPPADCQWLERDFLGNVGTIYLLDVFIDLSNKKNNRPDQNDPVKYGVVFISIKKGTKALSNVAGRRKVEHTGYKKDSCTRIH